MRVLLPFVIGALGFGSGVACACSIGFVAAGVADPKNILINIVLHIAMMCVMEGAVAAALGWFVSCLYVIMMGASVYYGFFKDGFSIISILLGILFGLVLLAVEVSLIKSRSAEVETGKKHWTESEFTKPYVLPEPYGYYDICNPAGYAEMKRNEEAQERLDEEREWRERQEYMRQEEEYYEMANHLGPYSDSHWI